MGKGDRKTAKGKRFNSSYGNVRPHGPHGATQQQDDQAKKAPAKAPAKKILTKKVVSKAS